MSKTTSNLSKQLAEIEKVLQGIPLVNLGLNFYKSNKPVITPVYLLPLKSHRYQTHGCFVMNGKFAETKMGFMHEKEDFSQQYYKSDARGTLINLIQEEDSIYLPLKLTNLKGNTPDYLFGINGAKGIFPLLCFQETEKNIMYYKLYKDSTGNVINNISKGVPFINKEIRKIFRQMTKGKIPKTQSIKRPKQKQAKIKQSKIEVISGDIDWRKPQTIIRYLDDYVIGQKIAKEKFSVAFSNYFLKVLNPEQEIEKSNIIFMGGTGSGKTLMAETLAERSDLPFIQIDLSTKTAEGYKGSNMHEDFTLMREKTKGEFPHGIVFVDEGEKDEEHGFNASLHNQLIPWTQGSSITFDDEKSGPMHTKNMLFILAGAFAKNREGKSLEEIITGKTKKPIGFNSQNSQNNGRTIHDVKPEDLKKYGFKPELIGRFPIRVTFEELTIEQKVKILTDSKKSILKTYYALSELRELDIELDDEIPKIIAEACPDGTGARELQSICQDLFEPIFLDSSRFEDNERVIRITPELAQEILNIKI